MEKTKNELRLLPNYFKKIGLGIILLSILFVVFIVLFLKDSDFFQNHKLAFKIFTFDFILFGIFIICLSREKVEDERIVLLRTQSMAFAFIFGVGFTIFGPPIAVLFGDPLSKGDPHQIIFTMLFMYLVYFIGRKKSF